MFINHESEEIGKWSRSVLRRRPTICVGFIPEGLGKITETFSHWEELISLRRIGDKIKLIGMWTELQTFKILGIPRTSRTATYPNV